LLAVYPPVPHVTAGPGTRSGRPGHRVRGTPVGRHEQGMGALWPDVVMALGWCSFFGMLT